MGKVLVTQKDPDSNTVGGALGISPDRAKEIRDHIIQVGITQSPTISAHIEEVSKFCKTLMNCLTVRLN